MDQNSRPPGQPPGMPPAQEPFGPPVGMTPAPDLEPEPEEEHYEPAEFPSRFWQRLDYMLHHPGSILESLRQDLDVWRIARIFLGIALAMAAIYGAVMGATNLLQASEMHTGSKFLMVLTSAIKVPALFLFTLVIIVPPIYVANTFVGPRLGFRQLVTVLLASMAVTTIILASTATVAFFFALTTRSYHFIKLLHVAFFVYAGLSGLRFFHKCMSAVAPSAVGVSLTRLFLGTLVLYIFVGTQLAWVLRPFVGDPDMEFRLFRPRYGNFYESVWHSFRQWSKQQFGPKEPEAPGETPEEGPTGESAREGLLPEGSSGVEGARRRSPGSG